MASSHTARAYLDYNATAPMRPEARAAAIAAMDHVGNPSSIHAEGRGARAIVEEARRAVAELVGVAPRGVLFTSGGTEAANLALTPAIAPGREMARLIVGAGEHPCVLQGHRFAPEAASTVPLGADGRVDLAALAALIDDAEGPVVLALQGANNETGVLQPVAEAAALIHAKGGLVVCDAVQMAGRADFPGRARRRLSYSVRAQVRRSERRWSARRGARRSFHRLAAVARRRAGAGRARGHRECRCDRRIWRRGAGCWRGAASGERAACGAARFSRRRCAGERARRDVLRRLGAALPNTLCFATPGVAAATLVIALDLAGVAVSAGSACSSGKVARSHVLEAMGVAPDLAGGAIRLSLGWASSEADVARFAAAFRGSIPNLRRRRGAA